MMGRVELIGEAEIYCGDSLEVMAALPSGTIDLVLCDLPYGTTANAWDSVIPLATLWREYLRLCPVGAIVLTAAQPFASQLVASQPGLFRYDLIWRKNKATGHLNAKRAPMRQHEHVLVFCSKAPPYFPQMSDGEKRTGWQRRNGSTNYRGQKGSFYEPTDKRYPTSVLDFAVVNNDSKDRIHPTQKPVELFEYLARTFSQPGQTVLDNALGSGTTALAAQAAGLKCIGIERDPDYFAAACERLRGGRPERPVAGAKPAVDLGPLFAA